MIYNNNMDHTYLIITNLDLIIFSLYTDNVLLSIIIFFPFKFVIQFSKLSSSIFDAKEISFFSKNFLVLYFSEIK